tara:strand:- start:180 stop:593 length:414 start_codon:yes stop_codon:yes gene_type:complete
MPTQTESAQLILRLYDLRREPVLREARAWFLADFNPTSFEEFSQTMRGDKSAWLRMVVSYWDMAASFVVHDAIEPEIFQASSFELFSVFAKMQPFVNQVREEFKVPDYLSNLETVALQFPNAETRLVQTRARYQTKN